ncbi:alpha/beta hydrolase [Saccharomonospora sp. NPDC006951]
MASESSERLTELYRSLAARMAECPDMDLATMRDLFEELHVVTREPENVCYAETDVNGVPALWCVPKECAVDRVLLYFHGGGFMVGSMYLHRKLAGHLASAVGARALVLNYRLAPEHPFPAQIEDGVTAYRWLLGQGIPARQIASVGDSAGGNLCTTVVLRLRELGLPLPAAIAPMSPWYDLTLSSETLETNAPLDAVVQKPILEGMRAALLGSVRPDDPRINPLWADLRGLPPMLIHTGGHETLLDDTHRFAEHAERAGVSVSVQIVPEMQHDFTLLAGHAPEADNAIRVMGEWMRERIGLTMPASAPVNARILESNLV